MSIVPSPESRVKGSPSIANTDAAYVSSPQRASTPGRFPVSLPSVLSDSGQIFKKNFKSRNRFTRRETYDVDIFQVRKDALRHASEARCDAFHRRLSEGAW